MRENCCQEESTSHGDDSPGVVEDDEMLSRVLYFPRDSEIENGVISAKEVFISVDDLLRKKKKTTPSQEKVRSAGSSWNREKHLDPEIQRILVQAMIQVNQSKSTKLEASHTVHIRTEDIRRLSISPDSLPGIFSPAVVCVVDDPTEVASCSKKNLAHALIYLDGPKISDAHARKLRVILREKGMLRCVPLSMGLGKT